MSTDQMWEKLTHTRVFRPGNNIISMNVLRRREIMFFRQRHGQHVFKPVRSALMHADQEAVKVTMFKQREIGDIPSQTVIFKC